jgi:hypothetical protein
MSYHSVARSERSTVAAASLRPIRSGSMKVILLILGVLIVVVAIALAAGAVLWRRGSAEFVRRLETRSINSRHVLVQPGRDVLPDPVARYLRHVLRHGQHVVSRVRLRQEGQFRMGEDEHAWRPFHATQDYSPAPVGFIWDARIRVAPLVDVSVRDTYQSGAGSIRASLLGVIPLVNAHGTPDPNAGGLAVNVKEVVHRRQPLGNASTASVDRGSRADAGGCRNADTARARPCGAPSCGTACGRPIPAARCG